MNAETLREKHPTFIYEGFSIDIADQRLEISFRLKLEPGIVFQPHVSLPLLRNVEPATVKTFVFHLGLVESMSYWKAACSPKLIVKAGQLNEQQVRWWHDLFIHGLGEFFYRNQIDFTPADFLQIESSDEAPDHHKTEIKPLTGDLVMVGGGKDSIVTLETLRSLPVRRNVFLLNPTRAALEVTRIAGYPEPLIIRRTLDPQLLELNRQGYLNGHTPFSVYLAFLGVFVGLLHDYQHLIASNEQSAAEGNVRFHGLEINHQYSKGIRFEKLFREYCAQYLNDEIQYFSLLRPLYELQIARLFARDADKYSDFCSCNVNRGQSWCGNCPKCAFVYLALFPFLGDAQREKIFGRDFFTNPQIQQHITNLVGLGEYKPFDCVGTTRESVIAVALAIYKFEQNSKEVPEFLQTIRDRLSLSQDWIHSILEDRLETDWVDDHFLPSEYVALLKQKLSEL